MKILCLVAISDSELTLRLDMKFRVQYFFLVR